LVSSAVFHVATPVPTGTPAAEPAALVVAEALAFVGGTTVGAGLDEVEVADGAVRPASAPRLQPPDAATTRITGIATRIVAEWYPATMSPRE